MASDEMLSEDGLTGTQEFHPSMDTVSTPGGGSMIWDPTSLSYVDASQERKPLRTQVPGMPDPETFQEKTQNPQFEGVFASIVSDNPGFQSQQYTEIAATFAEQAANETNPTRQRVLKSKEQYYMQLAERVQAQNPAHTQAENAPPASQSQGDVYNNPVPKRNPSMTDDSFSGTISHHIPKVTSMLNTGRNSYTAPETPNLRDCPDGGCGGKMTDMGDESICHDCGQREKIHYAAPKTTAFLAPLLGEGVAAGIGEAAGSGGLTNALRAGSLMQRVMGGGGGASDAVGGGEAPAAGSAVADDNMRQSGFMDDSWADFDAQHGTEQGNAKWDGYPSWQYSGDPHVDLGVAEEKLATGECTQAEFNALLDRAQRTNVDDPYDADPDEARNNEELGWYQGDDGQMTNDFGRSASSISDEEGLYGNNQTGHDSEPDSGNKASEGQDQAADELVGDSEGDAGGSAAKDGEAAFAMFLEHEPHLQSIADNDDSHEDEIAKQVHDALEKAFPGYLKAAARMEISKIAGGTCPTCHIDLTTAQQCGGAPNIQCPVGLAHAGAQVGMQGGAAPMIGQPTAAVHEAKRPKMCPAHDALVTYALTLQNPAAALQALSGELFGANSCQGGYEMVNGVGNPTKCKYKPEMVNQSYWDEKEAQAEERKLQREQQMLQQVETPEQFVDQLEQPVVEPEGQLVGGPEFEAQQEAQQVEEKAPVTQDIPDVGGLSTEQDYMPREQGAEIIQFPQRQEPSFDGFQQAASYKWSGPGMLTPELAPSEGPEQMLADTPPEELPTGEGAVGSDAPLDSDGNPIEVGVKYEVQNPNMESDVIPDVYTITAVDPSFLQFEVGGDDAPLKFTDTLSVAQIKAEGLRFTPMSDSPNATGDVGPSGSSDNTGEGDQPGSVTDLDTGGNSHASAFVDWLEKRAMFPGNDSASSEHALYGQGDVSADMNAPYDGDEPFDGGSPKILEAFNQADPETQAKIRALLTPQLDRGTLNVDDEDFPPSGHDPYSDSNFDDGGEGDEPYERDPSRTGASNPDLDWLNDDNEPAPASDVEMTGNPALDWLNEDTGPVTAKTAGREFSPGEQRGFVNEVGAARNLDKLDLSGTHYPDGSVDPYADSLWY